MNVRFLKWCPAAAPRGKEGEHAGVDYKEGTVWDVDTIPDGVVRGERVVVPSMEPVVSVVVPDERKPVIPSVVPGGEGSATNIMGWTMFHDKKRGRYKAVRRVGGKVRSIYLGKNFDPEVVREKITAWEKGHLAGRNGLSGDR
jgi:hypothetical protein